MTFTDWERPLPPVLMVRFMTAIIVLHVFEILLWAVFCRWRRFSRSEPAFYFSVGF